jgi:large subunit ribosomal protein L10
MSKQSIKIKGRGRKTTVITEIGEKLNRAKAFFLADYRGLTHQQLEGLRKILKKTNAEIAIAKNSLISIALEKWNKDESKNYESFLKNPTAALFAYGDGISAIKEIAKFIKSASLPKIKIGFFEGKMATDADFLKLSTMPTREVLLATLGMRMLGPLYGLHYGLSWNLVKLVTALNNVKVKKG